MFNHNTNKQIARVTAAEQEAQINSVTFQVN